MTTFNNNHDRDETLQILDELPALVWRTDATGACDYCNAAWLDFTDRRLDQELGHGWEEGIHPDDREGCLAEYNAAFAACRPFEIRCRLRHHSGCYRWIVGHGRPLVDGHGGFRGFIGTCHDITREVEANVKLQRLNVLRSFFSNCSTDVTAKKRAEEEVKHSQARLIHASKMSSLGLLVSSMAHEVNNPNNFIMFNSALLATAWNDIVTILDHHAEMTGPFQLAGLSYTEMREAIPRLIAGITDGSFRIKGIVERLREFAREGRSSIEGTVDVSVAVKNAVLILQNQIKKRTEHLSLDLLQAPPLVKGSPQQIEQVIVNLLMNALQSLGSRKEAVVVRTSQDREKRQVLIEVEDQGVGMSQEVLDQITEPFFTTRHHVGGTGLGLFIAKSIVKDHQGELRFFSVPGKGTVVRVVLPRREKGEGGGLPIVSAEK